MIGRARLWRWLADKLGRGDSARPRDDTRALGAAGERMAADFLVRAGYRVITMNARVPFGEADVVCDAPDGTLVIVEVKTRVLKPGAPVGARPERAVNRHKLRKLRAIARYLAKANGRTRVRIDAVAVEWIALPDGTHRHELRHHVHVG